MRKDSRAPGKYFVVPTWLGEVAVGFEENKIATVVLPARDFSAPKKSLLLEKGLSQPVDTPKLFVPLARHLQKHLRGEAQDFSPWAMVPAETAFHREVHTRLLEVGPGQTLTYAELAAKTGDAKRARAVGTAMSTNRIPIFIPCHRVFSASGLGGYSGGAGLSTKLRILYQEGYRTRFSNVTWDVDHARENVGKDRALKKLLGRTGPFLLEAKAPTTKSGPSPLEALSRSVLYQQLAGAAAATIEKRLRLALAEVRAKTFAERLLQLTPEKYRVAGVSNAKELTLRALAKAESDGTLPTRKAMDEYSDAELTEQLTQIRGIGPWSTEMLMMFYLGRPDVFPSGDLGVQKGYERVFGHLLNAKDLARWSERFRGHRTLLAWYLWRATELPKTWSPSTKESI